MRPQRVEEQAEGTGSLDFRPVGGSYAIVGPGQTPVEVARVPGGALIFDARALVHEPLNGTAVISIGDSANPTRFLSASPHSIATQPSCLGYEVPVGGVVVTATFSGTATTGSATASVMWMGSDTW